MSLVDEHQRALKGLAECKASASNLRRIQVRYIVKEVEDYLKTYLSVGMDISWSGTVPPIPPPPGGSHVTNVPAFDVEDFTSWKDRFLVYLDDLEPYLLEILENEPFVPKSPLSTYTNILCTTAQSMCNDLILAHEGPSDTRDTKVVALRLKFNAFKALECEYMKETFTKLKILLNDLENKGVSIPQAEDSDSDVEEDTRRNNEFLANLNDEFHDRAFLANQKRFYKRSGRDEEALSSKDKGVTRVKAFMAITEKEPAVGKVNVRYDLHCVEDQRKNLLSKFNSLKQELSSCKSKLFDLKDTKVHNISLQHEISRLNLENESMREEVFDLKKVIKKWTSSKVIIDQLLTEQIPRNILGALGGRGKRKETISSNEVVFTKVDESPLETILEITSDSESECENQEPLPPLLKLLGAEPIELSVKVIKRKAQTKSPFVSDSSPVKKADLSTKQFLLTLMEEVKGIKEQIKPPSDNSTFVSQTGSSKSAKGKQKTKMENLNEVGVKELRSDNGTEFRNHRLEEFCDEKGISQNLSSSCTLNKMVSIIVKRHGKTTYDVFRRRSPDISYFHEFGCLMFIHNHRDHLGKFGEKADDGFFPRYSLMAKAFKVVNIRRQEMKETYHITFSEDDEAITQSNTKGDEFLIHNDSSDSQAIIINDVPINEAKPSPTIISPSTKVICDTPAPQDRWSQEKHIQLVNILREPQAGVTTRSRIRDSEAALAHECLYVNFLSKIEPNKVINALKEEGLVIAMQEELDQNKARLVAQGYRQEEGINFDETFVPILADQIFNSLHVFVLGLGFDLKEYSDSDCDGCNLDRKCTSWGCQILGGKLVCWSAKKQSSVAMSSAKAEYVAAAGCYAQVL
ncbi:retrovirus-related pol polyprotein from transposon TNT 1-94 [Tanacetum coccineum]